MQWNGGLFPYGRIATLARHLLDGAAVSTSYRARCSAELNDELFQRVARNLQKPRAGLSTDARAGQ